MPVSQCRTMQCGSRLRFSHPCITIWPTIAKCDIIHKWEVHNASQRRQRRTEPQPQGICTKKFCDDRSSSSRDLLADRQTHTHREIDRHIDRQTNRSQYSTLLLGRSNKSSERANMQTPAFSHSCSLAGVRLLTQDTAKYKTNV